MATDDKRASQSDQEDALDRALDAALEKYATVEPRAGLEERILANLSTAAPTTPGQSWWRWGLAFAAIAIIATSAALIWKSTGPSKPVMVNRGSFPVQVVTPSASKTESGNEDVPKVKRSTRVRRPAPHPSISEATEALAVANPKRDRFPTPQPLSEQEKILASYVDQYPEHAAVIAQARMEDLRRIQAEEMREAQNGQDVGR